MSVNEGRRRGDNKLRSRERISLGGRERVGGLSDDWLL